MTARITDTHLANLASAAARPAATATITPATLGAMVEELQHHRKVERERDHRPTAGVPRWFTVPECEGFGMIAVQIRLDMVSLFGASRYQSGSWDVWMEVGGNKVSLGMTTETLEALKAALGHEVT